MIFEELHYDGDLIKSVTVKKGLHSRPLWKKMLTLTPDQMIIWADRFDSLCALSSEWALAQAFEQASGITIKKRDQFVRTVFHEINRLVWLMSYFGRIYEVLGPSSLMQEFYYLREQVFNMQEELMGARILPQAFKVGGCRRTLSLGDVQKVRQFVKGLKFSWNRVWELIDQDTMLNMRLQGLIVIPPKLIEKLGWWGIVGKAAGINYDARKHRPHGAYPFIDVKVPEKSESDALARFEVAKGEVELTLEILDELLQKIPTSLEDEVTLRPLNPGYYFGTSESVKGAVTAAIEVATNGQVSAVKLFSTNQRVWPQIDQFFAGISSDDALLGFYSLGVDPEEGEV